MYKWEFSNNRNRKENLIKLYSLEKYQFPLILSVILEKQEGEIFLDCIDNPQAGIVIHKFGWAQLFGNPNDVFLQGLRLFLFENEAFKAFKLRAYCPKFKEFFSEFSEVSERQKFRCSENTVDIEIDAENKMLSLIKEITPKNAEVVDNSLGLDLFSRNWSSKSQFFRNGFGFFIECDGKPVSACYACANAERVVEIDIVTHPDYRGRGFAKAVSKSFIQYCQNQNFIPNWDCYTNNIGSIELAKSLGFKPYLASYCFCTYNRRK